MGNVCVYIYIGRNRIKEGGREGGGVINWVRVCESNHLHSMYFGVKFGTWLTRRIDSV